MNETKVKSMALPWGSRPFMIAMGALAPALLSIRHPGAWALVATIGRG